MTYATVSDLVEYAGLESPDDPAPLQRVIERAEAQLDRLLIWSGEPDRANHRRVDVSDESLDDWDREVLRRATCAQAAYRLDMGEEWMNTHQHDSVSMAGVSTSGALPKIGPETITELEMALEIYRAADADGMRLSMTRATGGIYWRH